MTQIKGFGAYQNTMMNALNQKQKADAEKTSKKAEEQQKIRAAKKNERTDRSDKTAGTQDTEVQLSDRAKALLDELKTKYGNMDFFVADYSTEEEAQRYLSRGTKEFSVLIDPATLEAMAADEETKTKYTDLIDKATAQLADIKAQMEEDDHTEVRRVGFTINDDGTMSMFAELEEISERRREAIAKEREARKAEAEDAEKAAERRSEAAETEEVRNRKAAERKAIDEDAAETAGPRGAKSLYDGILPKEDKVKRTIVSADTAEDLIDRIRNVDWSEVEATDRKPPVGGRFSFSV